MKEVDFKSLDPVIQNLLKEAVKVRELAYAPYSKFKVGAALLCQDETLFNGCNVENGTPIGICAERTAFVKAVSNGKLKFKAIAVIAHQINTVTSPCGTCRQFMSEFGNLEVYMANPDLDKVYITDLDKLLPFQFKL